MYKVTCENDVFYFDSFTEISAFFSEATMAVGADDVKITVEFASDEE
jgi:hypothetical protein